MEKLTIFAKAGILPISLVLFCAIILTVNAQGPDTLYEMVPHVVLPQTIQYKPMPTSLSRPGTYTSYTNYPATYTAFPSYTLPYPTQMQSVQQAVYPVTPVAQQPAPVAQQQPAPGTVVILMMPTQSTPQEEIKTEVEPKPELKPLEARPTPALPRAIQKKIPYREIDVYSEQERSSDVMPMNFSSSIDSFFTKKNRPTSWGTYALVQWSIPINSGPYANRDFPGNPCVGSGYDPMRPQSQTSAATPDMAPYGFAVNSGTYPPYANPYSQAENSGNAPTSGLNQSVLNQIEQLLQQNPNMQFSAVMMGPNGQLIPLSGGNPALQQPGQPAPQQAANPTQQMQQLQTQTQYIQAMNQYVQQLNAARTAPHCASYPGYTPFGGYAPYAQPIPGTNGAYALANPYYLAMYQSQYGGYGSVGYGGGLMFNPYLPTPQGYYAMMPVSQESQKEKSFLERMRERRKKSEKQMCDAWRAPHYPEETGMRMPAKNAYPWGYFGAQVAPQETPNFGGYYGMYYGSSSYPGL